MKYFSSLIIVFTIIVQSHNIYAEVYVTTDKHGALIYSDNPSQDAKEVSIKETPIIIQSTPIKRLKLNKHTEKLDLYRIQISTPKHEATVRNNNGLVNISTQITPKLVDGYTLQLYLDGQPYTPPLPQTAFTLYNVYRGEHNIQTELLNDKGKVIALSEKITFYMHRNRQ